MRQSQASRSGGPYPSIVGDANGPLSSCFAVSSGSLRRISVPDTLLQTWNMTYAVSWYWKTGVGWYPRRAVPSTVSNTSPTATPALCSAFAPPAWDPYTPSQCRRPRRALRYRLHTRSLHRE
eukprot:1425321-Rhodomonas_salina.1